MYEDYYKTSMELMLYHFHHYLMMEAGVFRNCIENRYLVNCSTFLGIVFLMFQIEGDYLNGSGIGSLLREGEGTPDDDVLQGKLFRDRIRSLYRLEKKILHQFTKYMEENVHFSDPIDPNCVTTQLKVETLIKNKQICRNVIPIGI